MQLEDIDAQLIQLSAEADNEVRVVVNSAIERTVVGGGYVDQLFAGDNSKIVIDGNVVTNLYQQTALDFLVKRLTRIKGEDSTRLGEIVRVFSTRKRLLDTIRTDIRMLAVISVWLFVHVPLTFALLAALISHVYAVFVYW